MEQEVKISIIMPVYKVEEYVGKAIESIQTQTFSDWEFLIVDDGTPDRSGEICDEYAMNDSRIHVIHKENGGAPSARNVAIDLAKGKYMYFMDSDDWAEPTMLEDLYNLAERDNAQIVIAGFFIDTYYSDDEYRTDHFKVDEPATYHVKEEFRKDAYKLFDKNQLYPPWNKLFRTDYIIDNDLKFPQTFWDDFPFILSTIRYVERVTVTTKEYYHFIRKRAESETAAYRSNMYEKREEEHGWMIDLYELWDVHDSNSKEMISRRYVDRLIGCVENLTNPNCDLSYGEKRKQVKEMLNKRRVSQTIAIAKPKSFYSKLLYLPIKMKNVTLTLLESGVISYVKSHNTKIFAKLKAGR